MDHHAIRERTHRSIPALADMAAPPPYTPPQARSGMSGCGVSAIVVAVVVGVLIFLLVVGGLMAAIMLPALARAREAARRSSCQNNLKQFGLVYKLYAGEHNGAFPAIEANPLRFIAMEAQIVPNYYADPDVLLCPSDPELPATPTIGAVYDEPSYYYLGYIVRDEAEARKFIEAVRAAQASGADFNAGDLTVPESAGGGTIQRLSEAAVPTAQDTVPIAFDREPFHIPDGMNVLYMDGSVRYLRMGEGFPAVQWFLDELAALEE